ncbi:hypothetical protein DAEQUDRAFT_729897 [Daedalea quercina L-15889]|uniref:Uncharacterized protein n=1 Tax=Daedalea quercina L-15889 TaxID=1314783 RepID=A0A165NBI3_9APHY|nr:hypothetical protein DAEQUDRAFT_729897 [Daedalea quercina L-15889]
MVFFRFTVNLVSFLLWAALSSLRVYAVSHRNNLLTVVTVLLGLAPAGVTLYGVTQESAVVEPVLNFGLCFTNLNMSSTTANRWTIASRSCTIASDALAVLVLWYFTPPELKQVRIDSAQAEAPLFSYLWAHGAINFMYERVHDNAEGFDHSLSSCASLAAFCYL